MPPALKAMQRHSGMTAAFMREVVVFHSPANEPYLHVRDFPFDLIADPDKRLCAEFGGEAASGAHAGPTIAADDREWDQAEFGPNRQNLAYSRIESRGQTLRAADGLSDRA
jgi:hypothetical protein